MNIDPADDAKRLSANSIKVMSGALLGNIAGPVFGDDILGVLGLGDASNVGAYLAKIEAQLAAIQAELATLQAGVDQILGEAAKIEEQISDVALQAKLDLFAQNSDLINQNYSLYVECLRGLASPDSARVTTAGTDMFKLLDFDNLKQVAVAMTTIQGLFVPPSSEGKGLIELQHQVVRSRIHDYATNGENYRCKPNAGVSMPIGWNLGDPVLALPDRPIYSCSYIADEGGHKMADEVLGTSVAEAFKALMAVQLRGLCLLNLGWLNSIHATQVTTQTAGIQTVLDAMASFEAEIKVTVDDEIASCLQQFGKRLSGVVTSDQQSWELDSGFTFTYPYNDNWLMWQIHSDKAFTTQKLATEQDLDIALTPWTYEPTQVVTLNYSGSISPENSRSMQLSRYADIPPELQFIRHLAKI